MKKRPNFNGFPSAIVFALFWLTVPAIALDQSGTGFNLVIVFPGGPDSGEEGQQMVTDFANTLADQAGFDRGAISGQLFNRTDEALSYLGENKNSFVMGSLGFFLTHRISLNLQPLAKVGMPGGSDEIYYLLVKKGKYGNLASLKGKVVSGSTLYESPKFLNGMVFQGRFDVTQYFSLKPTQRPLSAVRKVTREKIDAVLLNQIQYHSLQSLPLFSQVEVLHTSPPLPALGLMMVETARTSEIKDQVLNGILSLLDTEKGKSACQTFGVDGFEKISQELMDEIIANFDRY